MSRGSGRIERRIGELFAATKDRALSVGDLAAHAFELPPGTTPNRKQRLSATRAAHRLLHRAATASQVVSTTLAQVIAETATSIGRAPFSGGRDAVWLFDGTARIVVDAAFHNAMERAPSWSAWRHAGAAWRRQRERFGGVLVGLDGGWRATENDRRLWFHPADYPVRIWAVAIRPEGVAWADAEIVRVDNTYAHVRYQGAPARLLRRKLARSWCLWRNVYFASSRSGYAAQAFDQMWREQFWRPGTVPPPAMAMPLAEAIQLLGVPADFTREDIIAAFRRRAKQCHPDHGGTEEQFIALLKARDRLLAALGTKAAAPRMPEFAPWGAVLRYGRWRPESGAHRLSHTRQIAG